MLRSAYAFLFLNNTSPHTVHAWRFVISLGALLVLIVLVLAVLDATSSGGTTGRYAAALVATAVVVPSVAAMVTIVTYVARLTPTPSWNRSLNDLAILVGAILGLATWLLVALLMRRCVTPERMHSRIYHELQLRLAQLDARLATLHPNYTNPIQKVSYQEAVAHRRAIAHALGEKVSCDDKESDPLAHESVEAVRWVMRTGYISLWSRVHRAEEALFELNPDEHVVAEGLYDELRLAGSTIPNSAHLQQQLRRALATLDPAVTTYFLQCADDQGTQHNGALNGTGATSQTNTIAAITAMQGHEPTHASGASAGAQHKAALGASNHDAVEPGVRSQSQPAMTLTAGADPSSNGHGSAHATVPPQITAQQARSILRAVRCSINTFRDSRWAGLVRARNRLMKTGLITVSIAYVLLCVPVIIGAPPETIVAAGVFYLVGALVGLFSRLRTEAMADNAIEDYGLTTTRLLYTPLFCGLAAVGGVLVINLLPLLLNRLAPVAEGSPAAANAAADTFRTIPLDAIFSLRQNVIGLVIAAVFGLTPGLLVDRLMRVADQYKADLRSSEASGSANTQPSPARQPRSR
jgi:hypothetical protein